MDSGGLFTVIPGWPAKSRIRHGRCSHAGGTVATLVGMVALNALSVSRWMRGGRPARPWVMRVRDFLRSRFSVERASYKSERSRGCPIFMRMRAWLSVSMQAEPSFEFLGGFRAQIPRGFVPFNYWFWVPLIQLPDTGIILNCNHTEASD
jgi:hypothetical protein